MHKNKFTIIIFSLIIILLLLVAFHIKGNRIQLNETNEYYVEGYGACVDNCHVVNLTEDNILKINELLKGFDETETEKEHGDIYYYKRIIIKSSEDSILIVMGNFLSYNNKNYISLNTDLYDYLDEIISNNN